MNRINVYLTEEMYNDIRERGNMANYLLTQVLAHIDEYGDLDEQKHIVGGVKRCKNVFFTFNDAIKEKFERKAMQYCMTWQEYIRRLVLQILVDKKLKRTTTSSSLKKLMLAIDEFLEKEDDALVVEPALKLKTALESKEQKARYIRLIPEIQKLMSAGVSLDDILNVAEMMQGETK